MNRPGLSTIALLFTFVTSLSFSISSLLSCFVLRYFMEGVFPTLGAFAEGLPGFGYVHHDELARQQSGSIAIYENLSRLNMKESLS